MSYLHEAPSAEPTETTNDVQPLAAESQPSRQHRRSSWMRRFRRQVSARFKWINAIIIVFAVVLVIVIGTLALVVDSVSQVQTSFSSFQRIVTSLSNRSGTDLTLTDFNRLNSGVNDISYTLGTTSSRLSFLRPFTPLNASLNTALTGIDVAHELALAAKDMLNGMQPTLFFLVAGDDNETVVTQITSGERMVELLTIGQGRFSSADAHLAKARRLMDNITLSAAPSSVILNIEQLDTYYTELSEINKALMDAPEFLTTALGIDGERNYLVLSQNNDELRPSGGYLSTYGWMTVRNGRVTNYNYSPTTATSPNPPPASYVSQLNIPSWWLNFNQPIYAAWDGSWTADFPTTAQMAIWYYNLGNNPQSPVDGAISMDITGFEYLLDVIGSVSVPGYNINVSSANFRDVVYDIRAFGNGEAPHKRFIAALYQEIFAQWQNMSLDSEKNSQLLGALLLALQEKHIMMYFNDERLDDAVQLLSWSGAQAEPVNYDYLMAVDANLGNKSNSSVIRQLTYDVDLQADGTVLGRTTVSYDYSARVAASDPGVNPDNGPRDYNNLFQLFVPGGSSLNQTTNIPTDPTVVDNATTTEFVSRLYIPFDSSQRFQYDYTTPSVIEDIGPYKRYRLLIQKQPGTPANAVNIQVMLPPSTKAINVSPTPAATYSLDRAVIEFRIDLSTDRWVEIVYGPY